MLTRRASPSVLTFDLVVFATSILLRLWAHCSSGLSANSCHGDCRDLVDHVHRLHHGCGANGRRYDGWRCHGVGHRLEGRRRHLALHGDQHRLVAEWGACQRAGSHCSTCITNKTSSKEIQLQEYFTRGVLCKASLLDDSKFGLGCSGLGGGWRRGWLGLHGDGRALSGEAVRGLHPTGVGRQSPCVAWRGRSAPG